MASEIDPNYPAFGTPTTESVRRNFALAADEITAVQAEMTALRDQVVLAISTGSSDCPAMAGENVRSGQHDLWCSRFIHSRDECDIVSNQLQTGKG